MYDVWRILLPAQIARWTWIGAFAGAYARPWMTFPTEPATTGCDGVLMGLVEVTPAPPEAPMAKLDVFLGAFLLGVPTPPPPAASAAGAPVSASTPRLGRMRFLTRK